MDHRGKVEGWIIVGRWRGVGGGKGGGGGTQRFGCPCMRQARGRRVESVPGSLLCAGGLLLLSSPQSRTASSRRHQQWGQTCMEQAYMGWVPQPEENTAANGITCSTQTRRERHCWPAAPAAASAAAAAQQQQRQLCGKLAGHARNDGENQLRQGHGHGRQGTRVGSAGTVGSSRQKLMAGLVPRR